MYHYRSLHIVFVVLVLKLIGSATRMDIVRNSISQLTSTAAVVSGTNTFLMLGTEFEQNRGKLVGDLSLLKLYGAREIDSASAAG